MRTPLPLLLIAVSFGWSTVAFAQVNSGSDGSDGVFHPTNNVIIDMGDHPSGIYQYQSVTIPTGVTVSFTPNANNTPVVWLVQGDCVIDGAVNLGGQGLGQGVSTGGSGGPGGYAGGSCINNVGQPGLGPGAGPAGCGASHATPGNCSDSNSVYGTPFLLPLLGGSGGGGARISDGSRWSCGGGGGGGALLIATAGDAILNGSINANGGNGGRGNPGSYAGGGSGGSVRIVSTRFMGTGSIYATGSERGGGDGRIRIDAHVNAFQGGMWGDVTTGYQPIIIPYFTRY